MELRSLLDWFIAYELRSVPGVVEVNSFGGELKTYEVEVLPDRLRALDVSLNELFEALEHNNATAGGGYLVRSGEQLLVRGEGRIQSLDEIGDVLIETRADGVPVRVRDVARVHFAPLHPPGRRDARRPRRGRDRHRDDARRRERSRGRRGRQGEDRDRSLRRCRRACASTPSTTAPTSSIAPSSTVAKNLAEGRALRRRRAVPAARQHPRRAHRRGRDSVRDARRVHGA